jgi:hypothetical protein
MGPLVSMACKHECHTLLWVSSHYRKTGKGLIELILFHAPSKALERFGLFNYIPAHDMPHLISVTSSVHDGFMKEVNMFAFESHTASELVACHLKVVSLLRRRASSLESLLWHYEEGCGATPFHDWLDAMSANPSQRGISCVDQYGWRCDIKSEDEDDSLPNRRPSFQDEDESDSEES